MKTFIALVHKDEDSAWGVTFPDLPGCFSAADSFSDVLAQAGQALELWFKDQPMVEPRDMDAIKDEVADDVTRGACLMVVPYNPTS